MDLASDFFSKMPLEVLPPGHELETYSVIDHGEATRGQRNALAVDAGNVIAFRYRIRQTTMARGQRFTRRVQFLLAEHSEQIANQRHALTMSLRKTLIDEPVTALVKSLPDFIAEAASQRLGSRRQQLPVEPGRPARVNLSFERQIRTHQQAFAPPPLAVGPSACFDDGAGCCIARLVQNGKVKIVCAAVNSFDDRIGLARQLVMETALDQPPDDPAVFVFSVQREGCKGAFCAASTHRFVQGLDDVAALAERAQGRFAICGQGPARRPDPLG